MKREWYEKTLKMAINTAIPVSQIARDTGLHPKWVNRFIHGECENSSVVFVNTLHDYLKRKRK